MFYYAILNEENICISMSIRPQLINPPKNHILINREEVDDVKWRKYEDGEWSEETYEPKLPQPHPTIEEEILFENKYQTLLLETGVM